MFSFGPFGHMDKLPVGTEMSSRGVTVRYMGMEDQGRVMVKLYDGTFEQCRRSGF